MKPEQQHTGHTLPEGTILSDNYIIERVLGEGGFGITYSCTFRLTGEKAAVKEYFPSGLSHRVYSSDFKPSIIPYIGMEHEFEKGREHFLNEASILKEFQNLNSIVSVKDVIETNGTVYLVMEYIDGITLKQYVKENGALSFDEFLPLITPVIQALIQIHKRGLIHRDISPENLMIGLDNKLHLIDFGAANFENSHDTKTMTVILKNGFAPPEQYLSDGKQGAWTDIYALCSTMYMMLTGFAPPESIKRIQKDDLPSLAAHADITSWQAAAIEKGMSLNAADRFQNMESLYQALIIPPLEIASKRRGYQNLSIEENKTVMKKNIAGNKNRKPLYAIALVVLFFVVFFIGILLLDKNTAFLSGNLKKDTATSNTSAQELTDSLCTMIDLTGNSLSKAKEKLSQLDGSIKIQTQWVYNDTHAPNTIIEQSIQPGTDFTKGSLSSILLTVSKGPEPSTQNTTEDTTKTTTEQVSGNTENKTTKRSDSSNTQAATSNKTTEEESDFNFTPIEEDEEYETFTID